MKRHEILDLLCFDDEGETRPSPYPLEALFTLEGLRFFELRDLLRKVEKDEAIPAWTKLAGTQRREMAQALGADDDAKLARQAADGLDAVTVAAKRSGVKLQITPNNRAELIQLAGAVYGGIRSHSTVSGRAREAVSVAASILRGIDEELARNRGGEAPTPARVLLETVEDTSTSEDW